MGAKVTAFAGANGDEISFELMNPVCCEIGEKISITRKIEKSWRLIGWGSVTGDNIRERKCGNFR